MSFSMSTLLIRNLHDIFGENDPARRRAAIYEIYNEDAVFYDPNTGVYRGRDEIDRIAGAIRATHPDFRYQPIAESEESGNGGRIRWVSGRSSSLNVMSAAQIIRRTVDGSCRKQSATRALPPPPVLLWSDSETRDSK